MNGEKSQSQKFTNCLISFTHSILEIKKTIEMKKRLVAAGLGGWGKEVSVKNKQNVIINQEYREMKSYISFI